jgi:hypothetical protein
MLLVCCGARGGENVLFKNSRMHTPLPTPIRHMHREKENKTRTIKSTQLAQRGQAFINNNQRAARAAHHFPNKSAK